MTPPSLTPAVRRALTDVLEESQAQGFLGPGPVWPHVERALAAADLLPAAGRILDLGSGGGLPGLPLAVSGIGGSWVLLDGSVTRAAFLREAVERMRLTARAAVHAGRAEAAGREPGLRASFDAVIARSFASPAVTAECGAPFLKVGGTLIVAEPPEESASRWPADGVGQLGLSVGACHRTASASYQMLHQGKLCPDRFPRRVGIPAKRPLF